MVKSSHSVLFEPINIGSVTVKNRFAMAPMGPAGMSDQQCAFNQRGVDYYVERAKGGTGLIFTGTLTVEDAVEQRHAHMPAPTLNPGAFEASSRIMNERIHSYGSKIFAQLTAGFGRVLMPFMLNAGAELVGPSMNPNRWIPELMTREITALEVASIVDAFGRAAKICKSCGFDGIQIHAVHEGYLLDQFTMSLFNRRTDRYGGSLENRARFAVEVVQSIKRACGDDYPVVVRYSPKHFIKGLRKGGLPGEDFAELGRDVEEGIELALLLEKAGYDAFDVDVGSYDAWYWSHPPLYHKDGMYLPYSELLKKHLRVPIITAGRMDDPDRASTAITTGQTDMIGLARPLLADPYLPRKIKEEKVEDIRPCLSCHDGCLKRMHTLVSCAVNPSTGRESELQITPAAVRKKAVVAGGGIAGCETARVLALRGHSVTLMEKSSALGGNIIPGGAPDFKAHDRKLIAWYERQLAQLGVELCFNTLATKESVASHAPDVVVVATGSTPRMLSLEGSEHKPVVSAVDVLVGKVDAGDSVVIVGGGLVGCETALWLAQQGKHVTIVEALADIMMSDEPFIIDPNEQMLRDLLVFNKVDVHVSASVIRVSPEGVVIGLPDKTELGIPVDTVILSVGYLSNTALEEELQNEAYETYVLGDCKKVRNIIDAVWESYEVARFI